MPYTHAQLKTEITTDPKALGYAPFRNPANPNYVAIENLLNATYAGVGVVFRPNIPSRELLSQLVWADVSAFTAAQWEALSVMLIPMFVDGTQANVRAFFAGLFAGKATTLANLSAIAQVVGPTRAEELWGQGTSVSQQDVADAINLP
jgi:hypothetical protein